MADNLFGGKNSGRTLAGKQKVKTAKRRTAGSTRWLERCVAAALRGPTQWCLEHHAQQARCALWDPRDPALRCL